MRYRLVLDDTSDGYAMLTEVEVETKMHPRDYERRAKEICKYILESHCTVREAASVFGIHNSNIYRAIGYQMNSPFSDLKAVFAENKRVAPTRAWATRRQRERDRKRLENSGGGGSRCESFQLSGSAAVMICRWSCLG